MGEQVSIDSDLSERPRSYSNSVNQATARNATGPTFDGRVIVNYSPAAGDRLRFGPSLEVLDARNHSQRYNQYGIEAGWQHSFADPTGWFGVPWVANLEGNRLWRNYAGPDRTVDRRISREDREWNLDPSLAVALSEAWLLFDDVNHQWGTSNLSNFPFANTTASLPAGYRFCRGAKSRRRHRLPFRVLSTGYGQATAFAALGGPYCSDGWRGAGLEAVSAGILFHLRKITPMRGRITFCLTGTL